MRYQEELEQQKAHVARMRADGKDEFDIKKQVREAALRVTVHIRLPPVRLFSNLVNEDRSTRRDGSDDS